ncbi:MAG: hypothetical protein AB7R67_18830 [Vicinamibacterales bacterium]
MLHSAGLCEFSSFTTNYPTDPTSTPGTTITSGGSANTKGSYTQLLAALAADAYGVFIRLSDAASSSEDRQHLVDIAIDPAGGSSYSVVIPDLNGGNAPLIGNGAGFQYYFPLRIPAGATVAARTQCLTSSRTIVVGIEVDHRPTRPEGWPRGALVERVGTITSSRGVAFTPGTASDGTWVSLGTLTRACCWVQLGYSLAASVANAERTYVDLGVGDASTKRVLMRSIYAAQSGPILRAITVPNLVWSKAYHELPAGAELWVRGRCENAPDSTYNALAYAMH